MGFVFEQEQPRLVFAVNQLMLNRYNAVFGGDFTFGERHSAHMRIDRYFGISFFDRNDSEYVFIQKVNKSA